MRLDKLIRYILSKLPESMREITDIYTEHPTIWLYLIAGFMAMLVSIISQYFMAAFFTTPVWLNTTISWCCAVGFAFYMNKYEVYDNKDPNIIAQLFKFMGARFFVLLIEIGFMVMAVDWFHFSEYDMKIIAQVFVTVLNYVFGKILLADNKTHPPEDRSSCEDPDTAREGSQEP